MKRKLLFSFFTIALLMLSSCSALKRIQISQDKLPWKSSGDVLVQDDFSDERTGWEIVNNVYE
ncbi:MAG: hypothetical protein WBJ23_00395, partial [Anaerolineaceae bacterium]